MEDDEGSKPNFARCVVLEHYESGCSRPQRCNCAYSIPKKKKKKKKKEKRKEMNEQNENLVEFGAEGDKGGG